MLLTNARIHTMDPRGSIVDSLVIREGRVAYAGARGEINPAAGERTLDLRGRVVLPGLIDGHGHLMLLARARLELDLSVAGSEEEIAAMVRAAAARRRPGEWIAGRGWEQTRGARSTARRPDIPSPSCAWMGTPRGRAGPPSPRPASRAERAIRRAASW